MKNLLCVLGGCLIGYLAKIKVDEITRPWPLRKWPQMRPVNKEDSASNERSDTPNSKPY